MPDYKKAIELLKAAPDFGVACCDAFFHPYQKHPTGCLFQYMSPSGCDTEGKYGCLTMIKSRPDNWVAASLEMTEQIANDPRIPRNLSDITPESLEVFHEYQESADQTFRKEG